MRHYSVYMNYLTTHEIDAALGIEFRPTRKLCARMPRPFWPMALLATLFFFWFLETGANLNRPIQEAHLTGAGAKEMASRQMASQENFFIETKNQ